MLTRDSMWRVIRSLVQLVAAGGLTVLFTQIVKDTPDQYDAYILMVNTLIVVIAQNLVESMTGTKLIGPQVVSTKAAEKAVEKAFTADPTQDAIPTIKQ
jgi:hypothetical protein